MTRSVFTFLCLHLVAVLNAQFQTTKSANPKGYFTNPIFAGDYADPSILRDGDNYYMVHSSFEFYPGLLIWQSRDLVNWTPVKNALFKNVGSVWAPDLVKHKGKFYIYFPASNSNFVVTADSINGKWSDPIDLKIGNIDPGHIADDNGKRYLYFSNGGYVQLTEDGLSVAGELKHSYDGWKIPRDWQIECFCMESPKIKKRGEYYYLTVAEGGTAGPATSHMTISARSKSPLGPWENSPYNPIDRTRSSGEKWWSKGHATLIDDASGNWWIVFHAYEKDHYNMGRQTLMLPVEWTKDGWYRLPAGVRSDRPVKINIRGNGPSKYTLSDNFDGDDLKPHWKFYGDYDASRIKVADGSLLLTGNGNNIANSTPLFTMPAHHSYIIETEFEIEGEATAGLTVFYNNTSHSGILADAKNILVNLRGWQFVTEKDVLNKRGFLRIKKSKQVVDMFYSIDGKAWTKIETSLEVSGMHHNALSGFLSIRIGLLAMGEGKVRYKDFKYLPVD